MAPAADRHVVAMDGDGDRVPVHEGRVTIHQPKSVFYNKVQEFNRDLSILVINTFLKKQIWRTGKYSNCIPDRGIKILDALSATGLRAVRYAKEVVSDIPLKIFANDLSSKAVIAIRENAVENGVDSLVTVSESDASLLMYQHRSYEDRFLIVDVDPYGSPAPFVDAAVQCITDGGMLMVTCTDMAILCGNHSETCYAKYGALSLKLGSCHEQALRIVLRQIESCASRYGRYIVPLLSVSADFYVRLFVQVFSSPINAKKSASRTGSLFHCQGCNSITVQPLGKCTSAAGKDSYSVATGPVVDKSCPFCSHHFQVGGPIWIDPIFSADFVGHLREEIGANAADYGTGKRLAGMLEVISEELPDVVLFRTIDDLSRIVKCSSPSMELIRSAILNAGYRVSYSHTHRTSVKTDAPNDFIWDLMRKWVETHPVMVDRMPDSSAGRRILAQPCSRDISFEIRNDAEPFSKRREMIRFQVNPEPNWGPKPRPDRNPVSDAGISDCRAAKKFKIEVTK